MPISVIAAALAATVLVGLVAVAASHRVPLPVADWQAMLPFRLSAAGQPSSPATWDSLWWDGIAQFYSWRWILHDAVTKGELPLWSPWSFCGQPLAANAQSACWYPPALLFCWLLSPAHAITALWIFHVALAVFLTWGFTRRMGGGHFAGVVAGLTYSLTGFMLAWTPVQSLMQSAAYLPGALWAVEALLHARAVAGITGLGVCLSGAVLAGHMQTAGYVWLFTGAWASGRLALRAVRAKPAPVLCVLIGFVLAFVLASPQLLPTAELGRISPRGLQRPTAEGYMFARYLALKPVHLLTLLWPTALGTPKSGTYPGCAFAEHFCGAGPVTLVLSLAALYLRRRNKWTWAMCVLAAAALLVALGTPLTGILYFGLPMLGQAGGFQRALFPFCLAVAVLAGLGAGAVAREPHPFATDLPPPRPWVAGVIGLALCVQLAWLVAVILPFGSAEALQASDPVSEFLARDVGPEARILAVTPRDAWTLKPRPEALYPPNTCTPVGVQDVQGYDSLYPAVCKRVLGSVEQCDPSPLANGNMILLENASAPELGQMAVKYVVAAEPVGSPSLEKIAEVGRDPDRIYIYRHHHFQPRWRAVAGGGRQRPVTAVRVRYNSMRWVVAAGDHATLTIADTPYPGWQMYIDGHVQAWRPAPRILGRIVSLPPATNETIADSVFWPGTVVVGEFLGLLGLVALFALLMAGGSRA
ncbi:MAG: hypothetical protein H5T86_02295 [Armatimonadetes bacterium]|nr:hypothetical protein [Armatimonadota bacterium]